MPVFHVTEQAVFEGSIHLEMPGRESSIPMSAIIRRFLCRFKARAVHSAFICGFWHAAAYPVFTGFVRNP